MDSHTYGSMVEHGGYATGGLRGEHGPEIIWINKGDYVSTAASTLGQLLTAGFTPATARDPDDGAAGVPAKV